jgi:uncharacterized protein YeaO (DUF488 family)
MLVGIKSIYKKPEAFDGKRILVDRLWPRGVRKSTINIDAWMKDVAPSNELRQWYAHEPEKWEAFKKKYKKEIEGTTAFEELVKLVKTTDVTFLFASKEEKYNNAAALAAFINEKL